MPTSRLPLSLLNLHGARRNDGRGLQRFHRREARLHVELDLAIDRKSRHRLIGSGDDGHAGAMQRADDLQVILCDLLCPAAAASAAGRH